MFKNLVNGLNESVKVIKGAYTLGKKGGFGNYINSLKLTYDMKDDDGFIVVTDDTIVYGSGFTGACTTMLQFGNWFHSELVPVIFLTEEFASLAPTVKEYIIMHEKGHHELGHMSNGGMKKRDIEKEIEADLYAVSKLGKDAVIAAMEMFGQNNLHGKGKREMKKRVKAIKDRA